ncbi:cell envelope integrity protein TolA [Bradyrhizobium sp.]|uniref:cell envelope integrity protein TolA n=1 Tax=Bradyrhizobium sp. TaxID=376 RepID=UPI003BAF6576
MPFSLGSYLLGVGTVVGAIAFALGSGALLTNTAMKETAATPTRVERVARTEPKPPAQQDTKENPAPPAEAAAAAHPDPAPTTQAATPRFDARSETESAKQPEPKKQETESAKQPEPKKQAEPAKPRETANQAVQREAQQKKAAERKVDRQKHYTEHDAKSYTEQKAKSSFAASRTRQPPSVQQDEPERTGFVFGREEPHFDLFPNAGPPPFVRSYDWAPFDRDD